MYGSQVGWSRHLGDAPVLVHTADRDRVRRGDPVIREWSGTEEVLPGVTLVEVGGHFPGAAVARVVGHDGAGVPLTGDSIMPAPADGWVSFMRSYPDAIQLSPALARRIVARLEPHPFDRLHGLIERSITADARGAVRRSAERYIARVDGTNDHLG